MKMARSRELYWFALALFVPPLLLLWWLPKVDAKRPHFVVQPKYMVDGLDFSEDGTAVCPTFSGLRLSCYNRRSGAEVQDKRPLIRKRWYGPLLLVSSGIGLQYYIKGESHQAMGLTGWAQGAFSPDKRLLTLAANDEVSQWDTRKGRRLWRVPIEQAKTKACKQRTTVLSSDGALCIVERMDESYKTVMRALVNCRSGKVVAQLSLVDGAKWGFAPDNHTLWMWKDDQLSFFDVRMAQPLWRMESKSKPVYVLEAFCGMSQEIIPPTRISGPAQVDFTNSGDVGVVRDNGFDLLDVRTGELKRHIDAPDFSEIRAWKFSPDGKELWWANYRGQIFWRSLE